MTLQLNNTTDMVYNWIPLEVTVQIAPLAIALIIVIIAIFSHNRGGGTMK